MKRSPRLPRRSVESAFVLADEQITATDPLVIRRMGLPPAHDAPSISLEDFHALLESRDAADTGVGTRALERLIEIAKRDTGQSRRVADFLLAWWNAGSCGSFDLTNLWGVDSVIANDMVTVFGLIAKANKYPDSLGYGADFKAIVRAWRPELHD